MYAALKADSQVRGDQAKDSDFRGRFKALMNPENASPHPAAEVYTGTSTSPSSWLSGEF